MQLNSLQCVERRLLPKSKNFFNNLCPIATMHWLHGKQNKQIPYVQEFFVYFYMATVKNRLLGIQYQSKKTIWSADIRNSRDNKQSTNLEGWETGMS